MAKKECVICGAEGYSYYPFCYDHLQQKNKGEIVKCDDCEKWYIKDKGCLCKSKSKDNKPPENKLQEKATETSSVNLITCIICGQPSNGLHFCRDCYYKYKERSVDLRITNCKETQVLDEYGNLQYKCADGRKVRSRAEMIISDFLFNNKIRAVYEQTIFYKEEGTDKTLHPDFFLPDYDMYLEYNELTKKSYLKSKEYAQKIYSQLNKNVIIMTDKDLQDIAFFFKAQVRH